MIKSIFTPRQIQVLVYTAKGMNAKQIGIKLGISHRTVEAHLALLKSKFNCNSKTQLIEIAWQTLEIKEKIFLCD